MAVGIGLGAFGAHGLRPLLEARSLEVYETAVFYLITQALGIMWMGSAKGPAKLLLVGIILFSGSLFLLSTASLHQLPVRWLGPITPIGGLCLMAGWLWAAYLQFATKKSEKGLWKGIIN